MKRPHFTYIFSPIFLQKFKGRFICPTSLYQGSNHKDIKNGIDIKELQRQNLCPGEGEADDKSGGRRDGTGPGTGYAGEKSLKGARDRKEWGKFDLEDLFLKQYICEGHPMSIRRMRVKLQRFLKEKGQKKLS